MRMASARFIFFAMAKIKISLKKARGLALQNQLLDYTEDRPDGKEGVARAIEQLGYVQIDTIAVIERAHHHTLWNRCPIIPPACFTNFKLPTAAFSNTGGTPPRIFP